LGSSFLKLGKVNNLWKTGWGNLVSRSVPC
jgi:hypothetical protein